MGEPGTSSGGGAVGGAEGGDPRLNDLDPEIVGKNNYIFTEIEW